MCILRFYLICFASLAWLNDVAANGRHQKRLLLNDQDVVGHRLAYLESTQRELQHTITSLQSIIQKQDLIITNFNKSLQSTNEKLESESVKLEAETTQLKSQIQKQEQQIAGNTGHGGTFVRWGRTTCPGTDTELVYSGYAAGQDFRHSSSNTFGGPANTVCLPKDPQLTDKTYMPTYSPILGTEYEGSVFSSNSHNNDMPCAVCVSRKSATSIMIPARQTCYPGWTLEYQGLLAGGYRFHSASSYICVDGNPEFVPGGDKDEDGHRFYVVNFQCGPLPCPPYHNNRYATCVVCSR